MVQGRGIYMADNPSECFKYGNKLILSKVLLGEKDDTFTQVQNDGEGSIFVIHQEEQIFPYCVINFLDDDTQNMNNGIGMGMGMGPMGSGGIGGSSMGPLFPIGVSGPQIYRGSFMGPGFLPIGSGVPAQQTTITQQQQGTMSSGLSQSQNSMSAAGLQQTTKIMYPRGPRPQITMSTMMHQVGYTIGPRIQPPNPPRYPWTPSSRFYSP